MQWDMVSVAGRTKGMSLVSLECQPFIFDRDAAGRKGLQGLQGFFQCPCKSQIDVDTGPVPQGIVGSVLTDQSGASKGCQREQ